jgi:hypothetical protein
MPLLLNIGLDSWAAVVLLRRSDSGTWTSLPSSNHGWQQCNTVLTFNWWNWSRLLTGGILCHTLQTIQIFAVWKRFKKLPKMCTFCRISFKFLCFVLFCHLVYRDIFFNSERGPYLFPVFSFGKHRSMHCELLCNQLYRTPEILK